MPMPALRAAFAAALFLLLFALPGQAQITRLVVERTELIGHDGYQQLTGHAYGELDPEHPLNAIITDLDLAPRNARGMVEYATTFTILKPADMTRASGVLLYFVVNRGRASLRGIVTSPRCSHWVWIGEALPPSVWMASLL